MGFLLTIANSTELVTEVTGMYLFHFSGSLASLNASLTILSSSEWKVITTNLHLGFNNSIAPFSAFFNPFSSSLTSILIAWKVLLAG